LFGHRGITHSLLFALLLAGTITLLLRHKDLRGHWGVFLALFAATASHGFLDAFTNGGLGVAFWAPFDRARYFFPWRPILVSPIGLGPFFTRRGLTVLLSEMRWVWMPSAAVLLAAALFRCRPHEIGYNAPNPVRRNLP
ncbi:MAG TPA: metal-dependent hydrolase, partial [Bryobacteraceae bacterium]|nr:metal-dependent hydrolase [Bryobacteraceae bacterium]